MKLLDTSVAIDYLRGTEPATNLLEEMISTGETIAATEVVRFELLAGVRPHERDILESFFAVLAWVPVDEAVVRAAAELARQYRRAYRGVDDVDYLIAGTAIVLEADLLTTNVRHFPMFANLTSPY